MSSVAAESHAETSRNAQLRQNNNLLHGQYRFDGRNQDLQQNQPFTPSGIDEILFGAITSNSMESSDQPFHDIHRSIHSQEEGSESQLNRKKRKITRARNACLPCRTRKCRCGGQPPDPCGSCLKDELECAWPTEDGRSAEARKIRSHGKRKASKDNAAEIKTSLRQTGVYKEGQTMNSSEQNLWSGLLGHDWLSELGNTSMSDQQFDFGMTDLPSSYDSFGTSQPQAIDLNFPIDPTLTTQTANPSVPSPDWLSAFDPAQVVMALSGRLPVVEEGSVQGEQVAPTDTSPNNQTNSGPSQIAQPGSGSEDKVVKVTWWRPHGQTAIVPGLQRIILKVRVQAPGNTSSISTPISPESRINDDIFGPERLPIPSIMKHLLHTFFDYFESQFPFLDKKSLEASIDNKTSSTFLLICIAAVSARFSNHPMIALPHLKPFEYGNEFYKVAKELLGSMMSLPSRETVMGLVLLAHVGLGTDSESEEWMFAGMAVRMAIDLGLQLNPPHDAQISSDERRLNRLLFWSVLLLDFALTFGTGRQPTIRVEEITQLLPTLQDMHMASSTTVQSPFPYAARQMLAYGQLITVLNSGRQQQDEIDKAVIIARSKAIQVYNTLPEDLHWNVTNLQRHTQANQAPMYLHLHLWMHTIIASGYLTNTDYLRRGNGRSHLHSDLSSGHVTPNAVAASNLWKNSARTIGDVLVLSDILNPNAYLSLPFCNQAFYVAGCCYVKEIEQEHLNLNQQGRKSSDQLHPSDNPADDPASLVKDKDAKKPSELFRSLLTSVATNNISTVQQGLTKQTKYWSGIAWVAEALAQRVAGIGASDIDLASITEKLSSSIYVADAGVIKKPEGGQEISSGAGSGNLQAIDEIDPTGVEPYTGNVDVLVRGWTVMDEPHHIPS